MDLASVIKYYEKREKLKGDKAICKALGVTKGAVSQWRVKGAIPLPRQRHIQIDSKGRLKVGNGGVK